MSDKLVAVDTVDPEQISRRLENAKQKPADDENMTKVDFDWENRHINVQPIGEESEPVNINAAFRHLTPDQQLQTTQEIIALLLHNPHESTPVEFVVYDVEDIPNLIPGEKIEIKVYGLLCDPEDRMATIDVFWKGKSANDDPHSRTSGRLHSSGGLVKVAGERSRLEDYLEALREVGSLLMRSSGVPGCQNFRLRKPRR